MNLEGVSNGDDIDEEGNVERKETIYQKCTVHWNKSDCPHYSFVCVCV